MAAVKARGISWDEENLQKNEDEKVPRMKIDEPKTPFEHDRSFSEDDDEMFSERQQRLGEKGVLSIDGMDELARKALARRHDEWESDGAEPDDRPVEARRFDAEVVESSDPVADRARRDDFALKRKQHYNMGAALRVGPVREKPPPRAASDSD